MDRKKIAGIITAAGGLVSVLTAGIHFAYRYVFYFKDTRTDEERRESLKGEQYESVNDLVISDWKTAVQ